MITRHRVWLDGQGLADLAPAIIITDIVESVPAMQLATGARAQGDGLLVTRRTRQSLSLTVRFLIREYAPVRRCAVLEKIHHWAKGKLLSVSHRPGQELHVTADVLPAITSALKWTAELSITFTAYAFPYWRSVEPAVLTAAGGSLYVQGTAPAAQADVSLTLPDETTTLTVQVGNSRITLEGLALPAGAAVVFTHDEHGLLHIASGGTSLLHLRTADSSDDLLAFPGQFNTVSCTVPARFAIKGVWA